MKTTQPTQGPTWHRITIRALTLALTILLFWLLDFFIQDIRSIPGPDIQTIRNQHINPQHTTNAQNLTQQITQLTRTLQNQTEQQRAIKDTTQNLQQTINQLTELEKNRQQNNQTLTDTQQQTLNQTLTLFLQNQHHYQQLRESSTQLLTQKQNLQTQLTNTQTQIQKQTQTANQTHQQQLQTHHIKLALWQLAILLPILTTAAILLLKKRHSPTYFPITLALTLATLAKITLIIHTYFPTRYFKYILITALIITLTKTLLHLIQQNTQPKTKWLQKQYREAYQHFLCPICQYPIRTGPRRWLHWTRRHPTNPPPHQTTNTTDQDQPYTCPACGNPLYTQCPKCQKTRHTLLPHCQHCGHHQQPQPNPPTQP